MRLQYRPGDRSKVCSHFTLIRFFSCFLGGGKKTPCVTQDFFLVITKHGGLYKSLAMALTIGQLGRVSPVYNLQFCPSLFPAGEGRVSRLLNSWQITGQRGVSSDSRKHGERRWQWSPLIKKEVIVQLFTCKFVFLSEWLACFSLPALSRGLPFIHVFFFLWLIRLFVLDTGMKLEAEKRDESVCLFAISTSFGDISTLCLRHVPLLTRRKKIYRCCFNIYCFYLVTDFIKTWDAQAVRRLSGWTFLSQHTFKEVTKRKNTCVDLTQLFDTVWLDHLTS